MSLGIIGTQERALLSSHRAQETQQGRYVVCKDTQADVGGQRRGACGGLGGPASWDQIDPSAVPRISENHQQGLEMHEAVSSMTGDIPSVSTLN